MSRFANYFRRKTSVVSVAWEAAYVAAGLLLFSVLSLLTITRSSFWFDESFSSYLIRFNFFDIAHYTSLDVHPPLYYWLLKAWSSVFGADDFALRSLSVVFGVIALLFAYLLVRRLSSQKAALWTLPLLAIMPFFIRYAQEARMYTLVTAIGLAATYVLVVALEQKKRKWWIVYGVLVSLGMWTHYFTALLWLAHWSWRLYETYTPGMKISTLCKKFFTREWIFAHVIAVGLFALWIPSLFFQVVVVQGMGFWIPPINPSTIPSYISTVLYYLSSGETNPWLTLLLIMTIVLWIIIMRSGYKKLNETSQRGARLLIALAFVPVALLIIGSLPPLQSSFLDRYLLASSVVLVMLTGMLLAHADKSKSTHILRGSLVPALLVGMAVGVSNVYSFGNYNKFTNEQSAAKQVVAAIREQTSGEPIIADSPWLFYDAVHYSTPTQQVFFIDANTQYRYGSLEMLRTSDMFKIKDLASFASANKHIWYIDHSKDQPATSPAKGWKVQKVLTITDPHSQQTAYHAVRYQTF